MIEKYLAIHLPFSTILKVILTILVMWLLLTISPLFLPVFIGALLSVALTPLVKRLQGLGVSRGLSIAMVTLALLIFLSLLLWIVVPVVAHQATEFAQNIPQLRAEILQKMGHKNPLRSMFEISSTQNMFNSKSLNFEKIWGAGNMIFSGFAEMVIIFIFAIYLLLDGPRLLEWCSAFFEKKTKNKIDKTLTEVGAIIYSYVLGQMITSVFSFVFVFCILTFLGVPNVWLLATLAGILDVLPVLGFIIAVVPAMLFALEVSGQTSLAVFVLYLGYHAIENYLIIPWVYGSRLQVSSFVVFFALLAAGIVAGVEGAIAILPIVASYPVIERIWLQPYLGHEVVEVHEGIGK